MRYPDYILKVLGAVALIMAASSCVKSDVEYETSGGDISIAPVTSGMTKSIPGAIMGTTYPQRETMGIYAYHHSTLPGNAWLELDPDVDLASQGVTIHEEMNPWEFGYQEKYGAWAGVTSEIVTENGMQTLKLQHSPRHWPKDGSLILAGFSPYYKYDAVNQENLGKYVAVKDKVTFNVAKRTLEVKGYTVGQYIPMTADQIADPNHEYVNESQSDAMFFMPQVKDGKYIGVNKLSAYPVRFYHALSLVEFKVRAEDDYDMERVEIDKIKLESVFHTGDFKATVNNNGSISAEWTSLKSESNITIFGSDQDDNYLQLDLEPRSVAQVLLIPGPTHNIKVECHVFIKGKMYIQVFEVTPEEVGVLEWEMGKRYVYNLIIGINNITFSPETYDWNDVRDAITVQ